MRPPFSVANKVATTKKDSAKTGILVGLFPVKYIGICILIFILPFLIWNDRMYSSDQEYTYSSQVDSDAVSSTNLVHLLDSTEIQNYILGIVFTTSFGLDNLRVNIRSGYPTIEEVNDNNGKSTYQRLFRESRNRKLTSREIQNLRSIFNNTRDLELRSKIAMLLLELEYLNIFKMPQRYLSDPDKFYAYAEKFYQYHLIIVYAGHIADTYQDGDFQKEVLSLHKLYLAVINDICSKVSEEGLPIFQGLLEQLKTCVYAFRNLPLDDALRELAYGFYLEIGGRITLYELTRQAPGAQKDLGNSIDSYETNVTIRVSEFLK